MKAWCTNSLLHEPCGGTFPTCPKLDKSLSGHVENVPDRVFATDSSSWRVPKTAYLAWLFFVLLGCNGRSYEFAEVEGTVTLNGKPLAGAVVRFYPLSQEKDQLPYASGLTDASGVYRLTHAGKEPGALVGPNRVVVYWPSRDMRDGPAPSAVIPIRYTVVTDSPLTFEVKTGAKQTIDLPLQE